MVKAIYEGLAMIFGAFDTEADAFIIYEEPYRYAEDCTGKVLWNDNAAFIVKFSRFSKYSNSTIISLLSVTYINDRVFGAMTKEETFKLRYLAQSM
jgi:hypothetical protein